MDWNKYAAVGDVIECQVTHPCAQTLKVRLETPEAAAHANTLLANEASGWKKSNPPPNARIEPGRCE